MNPADYERECQGINDEFKDVEDIILSFTPDDVSTSTLLNVPGHVERIKSRYIEFEERIQSFYAKFNLDSYKAVQAICEPVESDLFNIYKYNEQCVRIKARDLKWKFEGKCESYIAKFPKKEDLQAPEKFNNKRLMTAVADTLSIVTSVVNSVEPEQDVQPDEKVQPD